MTHKLDKQFFYKPFWSRKQKSMEVLMFEDYYFLYHLLEELKRENRQEEAGRLEELLKEADKKTPQMTCPHCKRERIVEFAVSHNGSCLGSDATFELSDNWTCCSSKECRKKMLGKIVSGRAEIFEPKFSEILNIAITLEDQAKVGNLYKKIFGLSESITDTEAYKFFKGDDLVGI